MRLRFRSAQRAFTLVEMMVAAVLAMLVLGAVAVLFAGTSTGRAEVERSGRLTENATFALELLSDEVRLAGFFAETTLVGVSWQVPDPCATALGAQGWSAAPLQAPMAIVGYRAAEATPACFTNRKPGTAALVLRRLDIDTTPVASAVGAPFLQISNCAADAAQLAYASTAASFTLRKLNCTTVADVRQVVMRSYFVATCNDCANDTTPTLKRAELVGNAIVVTPMVEGVENLQVEYGFDTDNDGNADVYLSGLSGTVGAPDNDWSNVVAARLYVLGRSTDASPAYMDTSKRFDLGPAGYTNVANDTFKRVQMAALVRLNNPAGRRELP